MQLGKTIINTPKDDPTRYDPEWRHLIATAWSSEPSAQWSQEYNDYRKDHWILTHKRYLDTVNRSQREGRTPFVTRDMEPYRQALRWFKARDLAATRYRVEPLLLTPTSFDILAKDVGGRDVPPEVFQIYERLFFNIRYDDGKLNEGCQIRTSFAFTDGMPIQYNTPQDKLWKAVGATLGYGSLMSLWMWEGHGKCQELDVGYVSQDSWRLVQSGLLQRVVRNGMRDAEFFDMMGKMTDAARFVKEGKPDKADSEGAHSLAAAILSKTGPTMKAAKVVDDNGPLAKAMAQRLESQRMATGMGQREQMLAEGPERFEKLTEMHFKQK